MWCWRRLLGVSWREQRTDKSVLEEIGMKRQLMTNIAKLKFQYFGHMVRGSAGELPLSILEGVVDGIRYQGAPRMCWIDNILEWSGRTYRELKTLAQDRKRWKRLSWKFSSSAAKLHSEDGTPRRRRYCNKFKILELIIMLRFVF